MPITGSAAGPGTDAELMWPMRIVSSTGYGGSSPILTFLLCRPSMSTMLFLRSLAIGLLSGIAVPPLLWWSLRGGTFEHARLTALMSVIAVQFLMIPIALAAGAWEAGSWSRRPRPAPPGFVLGGITLAFGAVVLTQAMATSRWLNGSPDGVGDPDGEYVLAAFAELSGVVTLFVGAGILIARIVAVLRSHKVNVPATTND